MADEARVVVVASRRLVSRENRGNLLMLLLITGVGFYVIYPLVLIFVNSFNMASIDETPVYGLEAWRGAFGNPDTWDALWNTFKVAVVLQLISLPIGIAISWLLARTNIFFAGGFEFLFWASFLLPSLSVTFGWMLLLDPYTGAINRWLREFTGVSLNIFSFWGVIWVHLMSNAISAKVILMTSAFQRMDASLEEASQMSGAGTLRTMVRITIPLMTPVIVVVFLLSFIRTFSSFEIEWLLGRPVQFYVFSTQILVFATRYEPPLLNQAAALASIIMVVLVALIPVQRWLITRRQFTTLTGRSKPKRLDLGPWRVPATVFLGLLAVLLVVVPVLSVLGGTLMVRFGFFNLPQVWTLRYWSAALSDLELLKALKNTLILAVSAGIIGPLLFSLVAYVVIRTRLAGRAVLDGITWLPAAVPGILSGLGLLWLFLGTPIFRPLYGGMFLLIIATIMGAMTLGTQILKASFAQLGQELEESSRMSGAGFWGTYFRIVLPLIAQTMVLIAVLKFMFAAQAASNIILLATTDHWTLALLALDKARNNPEMAGVIITLVTLLTLGVAILARVFGFRVGLQT